MCLFFLSLIQINLIQDLLFQTSCPVLEQCCKETAQDTDKPCPGDSSNVKSTNTIKYFYVDYEIQWFYFV